MTECFLHLKADIKIIIHHHNINFSENQEKSHFNKHC